jgi:LDH2 family malate/lactate/ureidoglycolate dehydrogenase
MGKAVRIKRKDLEDFCTVVFEKLGLAPAEASDSAQILVAADARGIGSHGTGRLWRYENGLSKGIMSGGIEHEVLRETPMSLVIDARGAMGLSLSKHTMAMVIDKARHTGAAFSSIRNSNHFGIAGFYTEMAARADMIGVCMTNTAALGVPTFGRDAMFGTNPIAVSVPALHGRMFTLDIATTCVTKGKVEVYEREGRALPSGWAVGTDGKVTADAHSLLADMLFQRGGGLLPLGGKGEHSGGHKGYGLAALVDIMTAITSGGVFGKSIMDSEATSARVCHFFGAIRLNLFRDPEEFKADLDRMLTELENARTAEGCGRVFYAGLKEHEEEALSDRIGVALSVKVAAQLKQIGDGLGVSFPVACMEVDA